MSVYYEDDAVTVHHGDCIEVMRGLPSGSVDSIVTDPPYGIRFMGQAWDGADIARRTQRGRDSGAQAPDGARGPHGGYRSASLEAGRYSRSLQDAWAFQEWCAEWAAECLRVLKPGGFMLAFGGARTWHRLACAVEDAGFEVRDSIAWLYGSGFPKSVDVARAIDARLGDLDARPIHGEKTVPDATLVRPAFAGGTYSDRAGATPHRTVPVSSAASAASARSASAPSSETASQPAVPARAASAPTTPGPQGREVWSRGEDLTWVTLSDASRNVQGRPSSRRDAIADSKVKRRGVPTAVKVMAIVFIVLLVVLAGLIWGLPMVLGPEFSLTNIVGSLLGSSATGASPPAGVLA